jgi:hypothetical protein
VIALPNLTKWMLKHSSYSLDCFQISDQVAKKKIVPAPTQLRSQCLKISLNSSNYSSYTFLQVKKAVRNIKPAIVKLNRGRGKDCAHQNHDGGVVSHLDLN